MWTWGDHDVHIARARRPQAAARLLVVHGAGGHSGALWPLAALLAEDGLDVTTLDLPLYGRTISRDPRGVRYDDWVRLLGDLVAAENDGRPLILLGASMGGMLAYEVAARSSHVAAVVATCLLDPRDPRARAHMTRYGRLGAAAGPLASLVRGPLRGAMVPMALVAKMSKMSRDPQLSKLCAADPAGGGARVPLGFLASYLQYRHVAPEKMRTPLTLAHPELDDWTPLSLSLRVAQRTSDGSTVVVLRECGHFPIEEPGISDLREAISEVANQLAE